MSHRDSSSDISSDILQNDSLKIKNLLNQNNQKEKIIQFNCTFNQNSKEIECKEIKRIFIKMNRKRIEI